MTDAAARDDPAPLPDLPDQVLAGIDPSTLPPVARMLVRAIGLRATLRLLLARGGTQLHIPMDAARAVALVGVLSPDELRALARLYGAQRLDLPKADKLLRQIRDAAIRADRERLSAAEVARRYGLSRRRVIAISGRIDPLAGADDGPILDLFGPPLQSGG